MRILMLNNEYPPLGGGMGTVNQALFEQWANNEDLQIDLVTSALGDDYEERYIYSNIRLLKVPVHNQNIHHSSNRELIVYAFRGFRRAFTLHRRQAYDLCLAWSTVPAGAMAFLLYRLTGLMYLVRVSGPDIPGFELRYGWLYPILTPITRTTWRSARRVIVKCQEEAEMVKSVERKVQIRIIPNGVNLAAFKRSAGAPDTGPFHVLCVARLIERKGQRQLIQAVHQLIREGWDVVLTLVGDGDSLSSYQKLVRQLEIENRVIFTGYIPREEISKYYASAHVFALPSYNEGMSNAVLEALASGLPLICTRTGGASDLVHEEGLDANGFTYAWGDLDALCCSLRTLALNRSLARWMGEASRRNAARFTWENASRHLTGLLRETMG